MKKLFYYLLLVLVFIIGIFSGFVYAFIERRDLILSVGADFKYRIYNSLYYFLSLMFALWLLKYSNKKQNDFVIVAAMYGIASLIYDVISIQIIGGILLLTAMLKIYFKLFPEDKFWRLNNKE